MATKFYQFDYAEMQNHEIISLGILYMETNESVTHAVLKEYAKKQLNKPVADIHISSIIRLSKNDFDKAKLDQN